MRNLLVIATLVAASIPKADAAYADTFNVSIIADVTGTDMFAACGVGQVFPACPLETVPYDATISRTLGPLDLAPGDNPFTFGGYYSTGYIQGIISNNNGYLTGRDLSYSYASCSGACPGDHIFASAATFTVIGGVPEPATWAMMLLGFLGIGLAQRLGPAQTSTRWA